MKLSELKGIGDRTEQLFAKVSVTDTQDLLNFFPRAYDVFEEPVLIDEIKEEGVYSIWGTVAGNCEQNRNGKSRHPILTTAVADDSGNRMKAIWYGASYMRNKLIKGYRYIFRGKVAFRGSLVFMEQPKLYGYDEYQKLLYHMQPIYHLTAGLNNTAVKKAVMQCFDRGIPIPDYLPDYIRTKEELISRKDAVYQMHFPKDVQELAQARKRIVFDEFFLFTTAVRCERCANLMGQNDFCIGQSEWSAAVLRNLGYELTNAQKKVYQEILEDMGSSHSMNRLIQGDVGSGKTILAFLAMIDMAAAGHQSVLMAPTEVLARQHYEKLRQLIDSSKLPFQAVLLTGSVSAKEKKSVHEQIRTHTADFIIGTHAVITEQVEYADLGLVITDEQHRFGVRQRENLYQKGKNPHVIVMSATPIPRSLAIILYGDLELSILDEKPAARLPIKNCVVDDSYHPNAYRFILREVQKGHQAYVICPMALNQEDEKEDQELKNVVDYSRQLQKELGAGISVAYLHGKMRPAEKNSIMEQFGNGTIDVLVSTTVVEVGVDVPNATVMLIENAERFGLSGLHQLRGRVGRGGEQSYCIFMSNTKSPQTKERLNILKESNDGFYIAEQDLKLRGPGDILGTRQSGELNFQIADIYTDAKVLKSAADDVAELLKNDPKLTASVHQKMKEQLLEYMKEKQIRLTI